MFAEGVTDDNLEAFLDGVDVHVDGLDLFAVKARRAVFAACERRRIPPSPQRPRHGGIIALLHADQHGLRRLFPARGRDELEQVIRFLIGVAPAMLHRGSPRHPTAVDFLAKKGPSTPMGWEMAAALAGTATLKILLGRGPLISAPAGIQCDAFRGKLVKTWRFGGNRNPLQRTSLAIARSILRPKAT